MWQLAPLKAEAPFDIAESAASGAVIGVAANGFAEAVGGFGVAFAGPEDEAEIEVGFVDAAFAARKGSTVSFFGFGEATLFG